MRSRSRTQRLALALVPATLVIVGIVVVSLVEGPGDGTSRSIVEALDGGDSDEPHAVQAGSAVVIVEGRDAYLAANGSVQVGTGIGGRLGLVGQTCVGFVEHGGGTEAGTVIVWPPGTEVTGADGDLRIRSEGKTVSLGEAIEGGADLRREFPELDAVLPEACRGLPMVPVGLNS